MKRLLTLATVGAFVLSVQGASLAQEKGAAPTAPPAVESQPAQPGGGETVKPEEKKTTKKKTTKKKTTKKKTKPKKKATSEEES